MDRKFIHNLVSFLIVHINFSTLRTAWHFWQRCIHTTVKHLKAFCETIFAVNYFCKMLHLRCLTGFLIFLCLRLRSLKFYLFFRNTNFVINSCLPYQFSKSFTVAIRTRSCDTIITMSIIFDNHNTIKSWGSQKRAYLYMLFF